MIPVLTALITAIALSTPLSLPGPETSGLVHASAASQQVLVAQEKSEEDGTLRNRRSGRPPIPSLKSLKQLRRPVAETQKGNRLQPIKPTFRPRGTGVKTSLDRDNLRSRDSRSGFTPPKPKTHRTAARSRADVKSDAPSSRSKSMRSKRKAEAASEGSGVVVDKEKDRRCKPLPSQVRVRMNFNEAEVMEIVQWISEQTCKNFIISDNLRGGKITILSNTPVTAAEAYRAFLSALNVNNMTIVKVGRFYKIQMKRDAKSDTIPLYIGDEGDMPSLDMMVTRLIQLKYLDANTINGTVKQLNTKDGDSYPFPATNSLLVSDTASNMYRIMEVLQQLDTPMGQEEIRVISVEYALATDMAQTLEEIFGQKGNRRSSKSRGSSRVRPSPKGSSSKADDDESVSVSKIIADERTNQLIVVASGRSFSRLQELINKLDVPIPGEGQIQVVPLKHADAEELANTLTSLAQGSHSRPSSLSKKRGSSSSKAAELFQGEVKVTADKATNSLVIVASQNDFRSLNKVIEKLDKARRQVFVEAVIMEVNMDTTRDVGFAFHGGAAAKLGGETIPLIFGTQFKTQGSNINSLTVVQNLQMLGFLSGLQGPTLEGSENILGTLALPKFGVVLQALQTDSNVNVLSTPHILTSDNEEAEIKVGENIPIPAGYSPFNSLASLQGLSSLTRQTGTTGSMSGLGSYGLGSLGGMGMGAINRQEVGLTLKIKPQINEGMYIRMELEEELSEVKDTSNPLGPTTTKRSAKTVVVVKDQQTVVVGGLMRDKVDMGESKIPLLGDIPVLGWFFRSGRKQKTKTNLLLFLTPYVITSQEDFRTIYERKMQERREFMERFYGSQSDYEAFVDFNRKQGPLANVHMTVRSEMGKIENGGEGSVDEVLISPTQAPAVSTKSAPAQDSQTPVPPLEQEQRSSEPNQPGEKQSTEKLPTEKQSTEKQSTEKQSTEKLPTKEENQLTVD